MGKGVNFNTTLTVDGSPEDVTQQIASMFNGQSGVTVVRTSATSLTITRKYIPGWAIAVAVVGFLFFFLGLLALFYRETETMNVLVSSSPAGSNVIVSGVGTQEAINRISQALKGGTRLPAPPEAITCPYCGGLVSPSATNCIQCGADWRESH
jgi:hypothetical protein